MAGFVIRPKECVKGRNLKRFYRAALKPGTPLPPNWKLRPGLRYRTQFGLECCARRLKRTWIWQ